MPDTVLIAVATPWESRPLAKSLGLSPDGPGLWRGLSGGFRATLLETGIGPAAAAGALERHAASNGKPPSLVVSAGLCGALQPGLRPGEVVLDARGAPLWLAKNAQPAAERAGVILHLGAVASADRVLDPAEKRALGDSQRAAAVDMESSAVRVWAEARSADFVAARAVLDAVGESAPNAAPEGEDTRSLLRFLAAHWTELPLLLRTGWRARRAMDALGRFLPEYLAAPGDDA